MTNRHLDLALRGINNGICDLGNLAELTRQLGSSQEDNSTNQTECWLAVGRLIDSIANQLETDWLLERNSLGESSLDV